ncbi:MAG TPA: YncE family protein [Candidatus Angelobacter sp.]|nr:YncE family protein [Candidatus Angelobacter sp.]
MKARFKAIWLLAGLSILMLVAAGCNDTLRQFIVPVPPPTGDPGSLAHAITLSTNPVPSSDGSDLHIDVSGDTNVGIVTVGPNPVFLGTTSNQAFVINSGDPTTPPTVSVYIALNPQAALVSTVTLPISGPDAVKTPIAGATSSANNIYIANRDSNNVSVIATGVLAVTTTIPLPVGDSQPVMIAGNAANNKIFVVNQGSGNVTEISTIDNTVIKDIKVGTSPVWAVMSTDGLFVFVVNQGDGTVSVIDTSLEIVLPCSGVFCVGGNAIRVGASASSSPNFAFYEPKLKRVYVSNTGEGTVSVIKANGIDLGSVPQVLPEKLKDVPVSGTPVSVTALSDGTRAYAALGNCPAGVNHTNIVAQAPSCTGNLVSVIDAVALTEKKTITVGVGPISIDASRDASRVYVVNSHDTVTGSSGTHTAGTISDISTISDSVVMVKLAPQQDARCLASATVFCPVQTPFMVRTFP